MNWKRRCERWERRVAWFQPSAWWVHFTAPRSVDPAITYRGLKRGINLGNALEAPREGLWGVTLKKEYFTAIQKAGFSCVRVPICWSAHASAEVPYAINPAFWKRVDWVIAQAKGRRMHAILNFHNYVELLEDPSAHEERFLAIWQQIARRYRNEPPMILFELLNEPNGKIDAATWNWLLARALAVIRQTNPTRLVVVGPVNWNHVDSLSSLALPDNDPYLVPTIHFYHPKKFTHQGAEWEPGSAPWLGTTWEGTEFEKQEIEDALDLASAWAKKQNLPMFLGEFGVYNKADLNSRQSWTQYVARSAEVRGMAWAYWEFCSGFGAYDPIKSRWYTPLLKALIPESPQ